MIKEIHQLEAKIAFWIAVHFAFSVAALAHLFGLFLVRQQGPEDEV